MVSMIHLSKMDFIIIYLFINVCHNNVFTFNGYNYNLFIY